MQPLFAIVSRCGEPRRLAVHRWQARSGWKRRGLMRCSSGRSTFVYGRWFSLLVCAAALLAGGETAALAAAPPSGKSKCALADFDRPGPRGMARPKVISPETDPRFDSVTGMQQVIDESRAKNTSDPDVIVGRATVAQDGWLKDIEIVCGEPDRASVNFFVNWVARWRFEPPRKDGQPAEYTDYLIGLDLAREPTNEATRDPKTCIAEGEGSGETPPRSPYLRAEDYPVPPTGGSVERVPPRYPWPAVAAAQEGVVVMRYDISPTGTVTGARVICSTPPGVFDKAALKSLRQWRYMPSQYGRRHIQMTLEFRLGPRTPDPAAPAQ